MTEVTNAPNTAKVTSVRDRISASLREVILGGQDGVVNVLGIVLAVAAATSDTLIILISGLAATAAESISMAAVAYTSTLAGEDYYRSRLQREIDQVTNDPKAAEDDIRRIYIEKGLQGEELETIVHHITADRRVWVETMMAEEIRLFPEERGHARSSAVIVGVSAVIGSLIPLFPFMLFPVSWGIYLSVVVSLATLFATGALKARMTVGNWFWKGAQMAAIGVGAGLAGYIIGDLLGHMLGYPQPL